MRQNPVNKENIRKRILRYIENDIRTALSKYVWNVDCIRTKRDDLRNRILSASVI